MFGEFVLGLIAKESCLKSASYPARMFPVGTRFRGNEVTLRQENTHLDGKKPNPIASCWFFIKTTLCLEPVVFNRAWGFLPYFDLEFANGEVSLLSLKGVCTNIVKITHGSGPQVLRAPAHLTAG